RVCACSSSSSTGSARCGGGSHSACEVRGTSARAAFPRAARSPGVKCSTFGARVALAPDEDFLELCVFPSVCSVAMLIPPLHVPVVQGYSAFFRQSPADAPAATLVP